MQMEREVYIFLFSNFSETNFTPIYRVPEIIFWHIPSKDYKKVAPKFKKHKHCVGSMFMETVAPQEAEMGMMQILRERSSVKASTKSLINHISMQKAFCPSG